VLNAISRREVMRGIGGVAVAGVAGATMSGRPARAAAGWGAGPNSGLPFWHGGYSDLDDMVALLPSGRGLDLVGEFEGEGTYLGVATKCVTDWSKRRWYTHYLKTGKTSAFQWSSNPFCSGASMVVPKSWPTSASAVTAGTHLHCSVPPTYTGSETAVERAAKQRRVWQIAADGWLDPIWRQKMIIFKRDFFIKYNLKSIRIVLRACHELNTDTTWGKQDFRRAFGMRELTTVGDYQIVQEAMRRYFDVFLDVFGNVQPSIVNDYAYTDSQLWTYWNTVRRHNGVVDIRLTCPDNAKLVGPDNYNQYPAALTEAQFATFMAERDKKGWPVGLIPWLEWAKSVNKGFALGEWGLMAKKMNPDGTRPAHMGWDNPVFIKGTLDFCMANAADIAFISYFNRDNTAAAELPAHLVKMWDGIDDPSAGCARTPPGDNNRCGARAYRQWMAANN
jgi:hypothetical protein